MGANISSFIHGKPERKCSSRKLCSKYSFRKVIVYEDLSARLFPGAHGSEVDIECIQKLPGSKAVPA